MKKKKAKNGRLQNDHVAAKCNYFVFMVFGALIVAILVSF